MNDTAPAAKIGGAPLLRMFAIPDRLGRTLVISFPISDQGDFSPRLTCDFVPFDQSVGQSPQGGFRLRALFAAAAAVP